MPLALTLSPDDLPLLTFGGADTHRLDYEAAVNLGASSTELKFISENLRDRNSIHVIEPALKLDGRTARLNPRRSARVA